MKRQKANGDNGRYGKADDELVYGGQPVKPTRAMDIVWHSPQYNQSTAFREDIWYIYIKMPHAVR
jgi:hypothetical protein